MICATILGFVANNYLLLYFILVAGNSFIVLQYYDFIYLPFWLSLLTLISPMFCIKVQLPQGKTPVCNRNKTHILSPHLLQTSPDHSISPCTPPHCSELSHAAPDSSILLQTSPRCSRPHHISLHSSTLLRTFPLCSRLLHFAPPCSAFAPSCSEILHQSQINGHQVLQNKGTTHKLRPCLSHSALLCHTLHFSVTLWRSSTPFSSGIPNHLCIFNNMQTQMTTSPHLDMCLLSMEVQKYN